MPQGYSKIPAEIPAALYKKAEQTGLMVYQSFGCRGIARVDMLIDKKTQNVYFNEVNPLPGGLYAHNWNKAGVSNIELVEKLVGFAKERGAQRQVLTPLSALITSSSFNNMDLVDLAAVIPDAIFDLRYATADNITGEVLYTDVQPQLVNEAAYKLREAANSLRKQDLFLVVWDAYRPVEVQEKLRAANSDDKYVLKVSKHCQGLAIDLTLADACGRYLDMGTTHDDFSPRAHVDAKDLSGIQQANRNALAQVMQNAGFRQWPYEWWHFDYHPR